MKLPSTVMHIAIGSLVGLLIGLVGGLVYVFIRDALSDVPDWLRGKEQAVLVQQGILGGVPIGGILGGIAGVLYTLLTRRSSRGNGVPR